MIKVKCFIVVLTLLVVLSGCQNNIVENVAIKEGSTNEINKEVVDNKETSSENSDIEDTSENSDINTIASEYYGVWEIVEVLGFPEVGSWSRARAESKIGTMITMTKETFSTSDDNMHFSNPFYKSTMMKTEEFHEVYKADLNELTTKNAEIVEIHVYENEGDFSVASLFGKIFVLDDDYLVFSDVVFWKAKRVE